MNKKNILIVSGCLLIIFIILMTIFSLKIFQGRNYIVNSLEISLSDDNKIDVCGFSPMSDESGSALKPYTFKVTNNSKNDSNYNVIINDIKVDNNKKILKRSQLKYQLKLNNDILEIGNLGDVKNNIIDSRSIESSKTNNYEFRIWISYDELENDWMDKYYNYNISVNPIKK